MQLLLGMESRLLAAASSSSSSASSSSSSSASCCYHENGGCSSLYIHFFAHRICCPSSHLQRPDCRTAFRRVSIVVPQHVGIGLPQRFRHYPGRPGALSTWGVRTNAFSPRGGGRGYGRTIFNLAAAGLLTYLTVTGKLSWLFDVIFSLWVFLAVSWWLAERFLIKGLCPNCGGEFQVFEFAMTEEPQLCPFCSQPFKLENRQFVREEPQFSKKWQGSQQPFEGFKRGFKQSFGSFNKRPVSSQKENDSGVIVDIEAEVRDKD